MTDRVATKVKYMNANGQAVTVPAYVKGICTMHSSGATGTIEFYDMVATPGGSDVPKCKIDIVAQGVYSVMIPEPGALFEKGVYMKVPANTSVNLFYKDI
jgi:hypothetical protein